MNAKYALALILTLQVSMSLCEIPQPSQELVEKYDQLKAEIYKFVLTAYDKVQTHLHSLESMPGDTQKAAVKEFVEEVQNKPEFQAFIKVATALGQEALPLVDMARTAMLGAYEHYARPHVGQILSDGIDNVRALVEQASK